MGKTCFIFLLIANLNVCSNVNLNSSNHMKVVDAIEYVKFQNQISNCFVEIVDYYRINHRYDLHNQREDTKEMFENKKKEASNHYKKFPSAKNDPANFFEPYASRFSLLENRYVNSPLPTGEQLDIKVDTIIFSNDILFCVAFIVIEGKYSSIEGIEEKMIERNRFDAKAIIGYRETLEDSFKLYPLTNHIAIGYENYESASNLIRRLYFTKLKGIGNMGSIYEGMKFKQNVGDKDFFQKSPYFQKHMSGLFNFQMYHYIGKDSKYEYFQCSN